MKKNIALIALLLFSFVLLYFAKAYDRDSLNNKLLSSKKPQEYMTNVFVTMFTKDGDLKNEMSAKYWGYLPEFEQSHLKMPHLSIYKPDGSIWYIDSEEGQIKQPSLGKLENIVLQKKVTIKRPESPNFIPILVETEELYYHPKEEYAESDQFIKMTKPGLTITGNGLRAFIEQGTVELLRDVKTYYTSTH